MNYEAIIYKEISQKFVKKVEKILKKFWTLHKFFSFMPKGLDNMIHVMNA